MKLKQWVYKNFDKFSDTNKRVICGLKEGYITLDFVKEINEIGYEVDAERQIYVNRFGQWAKVINGVTTNFVSSPYPKKSEERKMLMSLAKCPETRKQVFSILETTDRRRKYFLPIRKGTGQINDAMIMRAREYPVENLLEFDRMNKAECIFGTHENAKMSKPKDKNFVKCFACDKSADSIEVYKIIKGCDFKTAVKNLQ